MKIIKYKENPFLDKTEIKTRGKKIAITSIDNYSIINHETGKVAGVAFQAYKEVDTEEFVKIYTANVGLLFDLKSPGKKMFQILLRSIQETAINKDKIYLNYDECLTLSKKMNVMIGKSTFFEGVKELISLQIIAKSKNINMFFINPNVLFNGDRVAFIHGIKRKKLLTNEKDKALNYKEIHNMKNKEIETTSERKSRTFTELQSLMINKYKIDDCKATELLNQYPLERIEGAIRKIDFLVKRDSHKVDGLKNRAGYLVECIKNNLSM